MNRLWVAVVVSSVAAIVLAAGCSSGNNPTFDGGTDGTTSSCLAPSTECAGICVDTKNDNANCGACGTACPSGEVCSVGKCATSCGGGTSLCGSKCADVKVDPNNCGACGTKCGAGQLCNAGTCASTCGSNQTACGGDGGTPYCANTQTDNANCGSCGNACGTGQVCLSGACSSSCGGVDGGGEALCTPDGGTSYCADTQADNANCGGCGITCGTAQVCKNGACTNGCASSDGGVETLCMPDAGSPYCATTSSDPSNCGGCGITCVATFDGGIPSCVGGQCKSLTTCSGSQTLSYTGSSTTLALPSCVTSINVDVRGAAGGQAFFTSLFGTGGLGGRTVATLAVTSSNVIKITVGGAGANGTAGVGGNGGFNGGAAGGGGTTIQNQAGGGGGGRSVVTIDGTDVVIAGGGGGAASCSGTSYNGGSGGGLTGGVGPNCGNGTSPTGGTQSAGGSAGSYSGWCTASPGVAGTGGAGCSPSGGGGAGGGLFGGGGGAWYPGAGGSGFADTSATNVTLTSGYQSGDGQVIVTW